MIGKITGILLEKLPPALLVDVHGVGYDIQTSMTSCFHLQEVGSTVSLWTHFVVREDGHYLFGFTTQDERSMFRELIKISGVGPRTALAILSGLTVQDLSAVIADQNSARLVKIPGIGKKTAERLLLELRDKQSAKALVGAQTVAGNHAQPDIVQALMALGYNEKDALFVLKKLPPDIGVNEGIKQALKYLN